MIVEFLLRHPIPRRICTLTLLALLCAPAIVLLLLAAVPDGINIMIRAGGRRRRATRFAAFACAYLAAEVAGLCGTLRLRRADRAAHFALLNRLLSRLFRISCHVFRLQVLAPEQGLDLPDGPLLVFSRHAGPGDSFLLVYALLEVARRRPRVVLKQVLTLDPLIDVVLGRTGNCFVGHGAHARAEAAERIGELSAALGPREALLLFPEGGNFTAARRERLISKLRRQRNGRALPTATSLDHVLPPQPSGVFAAIDAAPPDAHVVFVAHTGLDRLESFADTWRAIPLDRPVQLAWWAVPLADVPADEPARLRWLERRWIAIDTWIDGRCGEPAPAPAPAPSHARAAPTES